MLLTALTNVATVGVVTVFSLLQGILGGLDYWPLVLCGSDIVWGAMVSVCLGVGVVVWLGDPTPPLRR